MHFNVELALDKVLALLRPEAKILDLGCGMGEPIAKYFLAQGCEVTGIDGSSNLIDMAKRRLPQGRFLVADMREVSLGQTFDLVIAWNSFFHLNKEDQCKMFPIFAKHLSIGGILLFTSGPKDGEVWSENGGETLYHASFAPEAHTHMLRQCGFDLIEYQLDDENCYGHSIWCARRDK